MQIKLVVVVVVVVVVVAAPIVCSILSAINLTLKV